MTFLFSESSLMNMATCRAELRELAHKTITMAPFDITVPEGHRNKAMQDSLYAKGRTEPGKIVTKVQWPHGKHNSNPSDAIHIAPYPIDWDDTMKWYVLVGIVWAAAVEIGISDHVRNGADWDRDFQYNDQTFNDLAHWEWVG